MIKETRPETKRLDLQFPTYINLFVYTRLSSHTNSKRHLLKKQRLKRSVLTGGRI